VKRGWCEFISTAKEWRGKGVASALICETLREFARRGLEESALGVHAENPTGALSLYEGLGFERVSGGTIYERELADA
jgi:mycothiol synthase